MKLNFIKNRAVFILICVFLATVLVLLSLWKQMSNTVEGMIMMDFVTSSNPDNTNLTDMELQSYKSAMISFEKKFETAEKANSSITNYTGGFVYDPSGNTLDDPNTDKISVKVLDDFIKHLTLTSKSFQNFADALTKMKKDKIKEYQLSRQSLTVTSV